MRRQTGILAGLILCLLGTLPASAQLVQGPSTRESGPAAWQHLMAVAEQCRRGGRYEEAERACAEATEMVRQLAPPDTHMGQCQEEMGYIYLSQGKYEPAERLFKDAIDSLEKAVGPNDPTLAIALDSLVNCYMAQRKFAQAVPVGERIVSISQFAVNQQNRELARRLQGLSGVYFSNGQTDKAKSTLDDAIDLAHQCGDQEGEMQYRLIAGRSCEVLHDSHAAIEQYTKGLAVATQCGNNDMAFQFQQGIADLDCAAGDYGGAEKLAKESLAMRQHESEAGASADAQMNIAICRESLGKIYMAWSRPEPARVEYAEAVKIVEKAGGAETGELARFLGGLADAERAGHQLDDSAIHYERAIAIAKGSGQTAALGQLHAKYADLLDEQKRPEAARAHRAEAEAITAVAATQATTRP